MIDVKNTPAGTSHVSAIISITCTVFSLAFTIDRLEVE